MSGAAAVTLAAPTLTKIVATLGPASDSPEVVRKLIAAGVSVFRLNFSHGDFAAHERRLRVVREASADLGQPVAILGDLQGPKIRVGQLPEAGVVLTPGQDIVFTACEAELWARTHDAARLPTAYDQLASEVKPGERVLINDGAVRLLAVEREPGDGPGVLRCRVLVGGLVTSKKGINLPDSDVKASAITEQDWACAEWAVAHEVDYLALSFVRTAAEVLELKHALAGMCPVDFGVEGAGRERAGKGSFIPVIAKIEKPQALANLDAIVEAADAIMVARGDLGVEMDVAEVPLVQRRLIAACDDWGKPCIVATQMLESMIESSTPTRAEASDVATAVLAGADAVMLSGETAVGKHPALVVETMRRIVAAAEREPDACVQGSSTGKRLVASRYRTAALAHGAFHVARDLGAKLVACWSQEGGTARYLSQTGLRIPIVAYTDDPRQVRRMALLRAVTPRLMAVPATGSLADWNRAVERDLLAIGWVKLGDPMVLVAGRPLGVQGATTALAVHTIGDPLTGYMRM